MQRLALERRWEADDNPQSKRHGHMARRRHRPFRSLGPGDQPLLPFPLRPSQSPTGAFPPTTLAAPLRHTACNASHALAHLASRDRQLECALADASTASSLLPPAISLGQSDLPFRHPLPSRAPLFFLRTGGREACRSLDTGLEHSHNASGYYRIARRLYAPPLTAHHARAAPSFTMNANLEEAANVATEYLSSENRFPSLRACLQHRYDRTA